MSIQYVRGVRIGTLTIDPGERVPAALWTHRPARRPPADRVLAAAPLAAGWRRALGVPFNASAVAMGHRLELLPTGYGPGGAALLLTRDGHRTLVVGPTTEALQPRRADALVLFAGAEPGADTDWLERAKAASTDAPLVVTVPDGGAAMAVADALDAAEVPHRRPGWLGRGLGPRSSAVRLTTTAGGLAVDLRPQARLEWLVRLAGRVAPRRVRVHGPQAVALAAALAVEGHQVRILDQPRQLDWLDAGLERVAPMGDGRRREGELDEPDWR